MSRWSLSSEWADNVELAGRKKITKIIDDRVKISYCHRYQ